VNLCIPACHWHDHDVDGDGGQEGFRRTVRHFFVVWGRNVFFFSFTRADAVSWSVSGACSSPEVAVCAEEQEENARAAQV
jgi:hypothetical protein